MIFRFSTLVLLFGAAASLGGQSFYEGGVSAASAARAGIYVPSDDNALDALAVNPAGLSTLTGPVANVSVRGMLARGSFQNASNAGSPMRWNGGVVPFGAVGLPLGPRWTLAAGFLPDLLSSAKWQYRDTPGAGGADYGEQRETSEILALRTAFGVAYRVSPRLSVGATVSAIQNENTLEMPYVFQSHPALKGLKTLLALHTAGTAWNTGVGAMVRPTSHWAMGVSYRAKTAVTSSGRASGSLRAQFDALQIPFRPDFLYRAQVRVELPQTARVSLAWQKSPVLRILAESEWTDWRGSFGHLPVSLTNGSNGQINGFLQSSGIQDDVPLHWKDQFTFRAAVERQLGENLSASGGYVHQNSPVPSSTLTPLTAAIMGNVLTAGADYRRGRTRFDLAYQFNFTAGQQVGETLLRSGEFRNSRVRVGEQALTLSTTFHLR